MVRGTVVFIVVVGIASVAMGQAVAFIPNANDNNISVVNPVTGAVTGPFALPNPGNPRTVAVNATGSRVYVANFTGASVSVLDTSLLPADPVLTPPIAVGSNPHGIVVKPDGSKVYVANQVSNTVSVITTASNTVTNTIAVGAAPRALIINPAGTKLYVCNQGDNPDTISVIDLSTEMVVGTIIGADPAPYVGAITPDGSKLYVPLFETTDSNILVIDTATDTAITTIATAGAHSGSFMAAVNPAGTRVYVSNQNSDDVLVIDVATNTLVPGEAISGMGFDGPNGIQVSSDGNYVLITDVAGASDGLYIVDVTTPTSPSLERFVALGNAPVSLGDFLTDGAVPVTLQSLTVE